MEFKKIFANEIVLHLENLLSINEVEKLIENPKYEQQGDMAFPCFSLAKLLKKAPNLIAIDLASKINHPFIENVVADGPYVNGFLNKEIVSKRILDTILSEGNHYGNHSIGMGKNVVIDFSSPNIAKPFSMGHLRSTVIGNSLSNIIEKCGFNIIKVNHLGDWGTQFGKLIVAYKLWGEEQQVRNNPIKELLHLYVKFHEEAENKPNLEDEARYWFKKLEDGDEEAKILWKWFRDESLKEFSKIYGLLDVEFDSYQGEAFYNDKMDKTIKHLYHQQLIKESEGADVIELKEFDLPPCLIRKSDGATLYATRDLTAAMFRQKEYQFEKALYVVGQEQSLHFKQVFLVLEKMGYSWSQGLEHVPFGFILKEGKKMSTRKGKVVLLEHVIKEAIELAEENIKLKNPDLENKSEVAKMVGVGAIIFHDLKNERQNNVEFSLEDMLRFEGTTGPYVQYTHARATSILRKGNDTNDFFNVLGLSDNHSWSVLKILMEFPNVIERSFNLNEPSQISKYLLDVSQEFNTYYSRVKILAEDNEKQGRLALVKSITIVLKEGLRLLGIKAPEKM
ncbi:arginine--tRNA ligase [Halalkalibacter akibai]|uniref:Arginine--tRNA ligase n=1 Tax=Halalkalibacter akibai (strain ATCC 43226 / DSM 21942 / CIP 109018 / JCM 9157 / 1139) TaxID=1236973 RepID=W4QTA9_HALA3|nr:arginine--tRNA ligase [Halalkalibacter akibai]GAE35137.1 arginyl-tRNA synthetase [Halalkalibacter akibai JCM 9157]